MSQQSDSCQQDNQGASKSNSSSTPKSWASQLRLRGSECARKNHRSRSETKSFEKLSDVPGWNLDSPGAFRLQLLAPKSIHVLWTQYCCPTGSQRQSTCMLMSLAVKIPRFCPKRPRSLHAIGDVEGQYLEMDGQPMLLLWKFGPEPKYSSRRTGYAKKDPVLQPFVLAPMSRLTDCGIRSHHGGHVF